jgi:hypothetical protein
MGRVLFVVALIVGSTGFLGWVMALMHDWPTKITLEFLDWNFVSAALSFWSFVLTTMALGFADMQWSQHRETQEAQARAFAPAIRLDFVNCASQFDPERNGLFPALKENVRDLPGRAVGCRSTHTAAVMRFLDRMDCFGKDGPAIARASATILAANAALSDLALIAVENQNLVTIDQLARRAATLVESAHAEAKAAAILLLKWEPAK